MRALIPILFAFAAAANADQIMVNLDSTTLSGGPGVELMFTGTLTNTTADTLFINSDSFTFQITGALDDSPFLTNAPISIDAGLTSGDFEMFDINIPVSEPPGTYIGTFTVLGGSDGSVLSNLGSASFSVNVATPEPASYLLLGASLAFLLGRRHLRLLSR